MPRSSSIHPLHDPAVSLGDKILLLSELERVDTPLDRAARGELEPSWRFDLKMLAARLLTGNKADSFQRPDRDPAAPDLHRSSRRLQPAAEVSAGR